MPPQPTHWDVNLRANLRLWPSLPPNVAGLCGAIGSIWDEDNIASTFFGPTEGSDRRRAVRQTYEAMAYEGLLLRDETNRLRTTDLGHYVLTFLGVGDGPIFARSGNLPIVNNPLIHGLSVIVEIRALWSLMRRLDNWLTNEELNRAMSTIASLDDIEGAAQLVRFSRESGDPTLIGPRIYDDHNYDTPRQSDQRKAMNPHFLLAGGGGLFIELDGVERRLDPRCERVIDAALRSSGPLIHASTAADAARLISRASQVPPPMET